MTPLLLALSVAAAVTSYEGSITKSVRKTETSYTLKWFLWGFTISTNLWATCLIFIRAWYVSSTLMDMSSMMRRIL